MSKKMTTCIYASAILFTAGIFFSQGERAAAGGSLSLGQAAFEYQIIQGSIPSSSSKYIVLDSQIEEGYDFVNGKNTTRTLKTSSFYIRKNLGTLRIFAKLGNMGGVYQLSSPNDTPAPIGSPLYREWTQIQEGGTYALYDKTNGFLVKLTPYKINMTGLANEAPLISFPPKGAMQTMSDIPRRLRLEWYPVENARSYDVELVCSGCAEANWNSPFSFTVTDPIFEKIIQTDAGHYVRVRARFDQNTAGLWTAYIPVASDAGKHIYAGIEVKANNPTPKATDTVIITGQSLEGRQYDRIIVYVNGESQSAVCYSTSRCELAAGPFLQEGKIFYSVLGTTNSSPYYYHFNEGSVTIPRTVATAITRLANTNSYIPQADIAWSVLPDANSYQVEIVVDKKVIDTLSTTNTFLPPYPFTVSGVYRFRVRGVYADGTVSPWSIEQSLTYQKQTVAPTLTPVRPPVPLRKQPPYSVRLFFLLRDILLEL